jgi:hypothetical protein
MKTVRRSFAQKSKRFLNQWDNANPVRITFNLKKTKKRMDIVI